MPISNFLKYHIDILTLLFFFFSFVLGCSGGSDSAGTETGNPRYAAISGVAQKGPLQLGSLVTAQELDSSLSPTGKQYTYQINSDLGTFAADSNTYTSRFIDLLATGYYYDEVTNAVSTGTITLNGISDLSEHKVLNVNLLTTLTYQRIKKLVTTQGMTIAAATAQAENEVLSIFNIPNGSRYGSFNSLDISGGRDGDYMLAAISSLFVNGNHSGKVSALMAKVQFDIAEDGVLDNAEVKAALAGSAQSLDTVVVAANLSAKYAPKNFSASDIANWIDQKGDGVIGKFRFYVANADSSSTFTLPAFAVDQFAGLPIAISAGELKVNGSIVSGEVTLKTGDTVVITPPAETFGTTPAETFPAVVELKIYLKTGTTNLSCITFGSGPGSLITARFQHTATLLNNGKVLVAGGWNGGASIASTELYVPATYCWADAGNLTSARICHTATLLGNGKVLLAGGFRYGEKSSWNSAELYDPATDTWSSAGNMTTARKYHTATLLGNGKVLVVGGTLFDINQFLASTEIYDPATNKWSAVESMVTERFKHTATLLANGKVLVAGGLGRTTYVDSAELYDPLTDTWSSAGSLNIARSGHSANLLNNGKVLITGGLTASGVGITTSAELYDPATNTWSAAGSLNKGRYSHTATLLSNGKVMVVGGYNNREYFTSIELYNPATNVWSSEGNITNARVVHTATLLSNGRVLVVGGHNAGGALSSVEISRQW